jgi:hypothetical protein
MKSARTGGQKSSCTSTSTSAGLNAMVVVRGPGVERNKKGPSCIGAKREPLGRHSPSCAAFPRLPARVFT